jgi:hypothetical protein
MQESERGRSSYADIAGMLAVVTVLAGIGVPPSLLRPGLSSSGRLLAGGIVPILAVAGALAVGSVVVSAARPLLARWCVYLSVALINIAGALSGSLGVGGVGVGGTLVLTSPVVAVIVWRELKVRRVRSEGTR